MVIISDPVGDMLTRISNGYMAGRKTVMVPLSKEKEAVMKVLVDKKFVDSYKIVGENLKKEMQVVLSPDRKEGISVKRVSKPGRRVYVSVKEFYTVKGGRGILLLSTSKGMMDSKKAKELKIGGELLAEVY